jgi:hypothetical protein
MAANFWTRAWEKELYEENQARNRAEEIAHCLVYESFQIIERASKQFWRESVVIAFANLSRAQAILGDSFNKIRQELYEEAKKRFLASDCSEQEIEAAAYEGEYCGETYVLPVEMGEDSIHYGFVAEMFFVSEFWFDEFCYISGSGWRIKVSGRFGDYPREEFYEQERGIKGVIYRVMRRKIDIWREALEKRDVSVRGVGGWLEKLEKNINDPGWLAKVEELLLRVDHFGVMIISGQDNHQS